MPLQIFDKMTAPVQYRDKKIGDYPKKSPANTTIEMK
jgi:hypothetical protein